MKSLREILQQQANGDFSDATAGESMIPRHNPEDMKCALRALQQLINSRENTANRVAKGDRLLPPAIALPLML